MLSSGRPLAAARIGLGIASILNAFEMYLLLSRIAAGMLALPVSPVVPSPTQGAVVAYLVVATLAGFALAVGWHTAWAAAVTTLLNVGVFLWDQQTYSSHRFLVTLLVAYLIFARSDATWSVSRHHPGPVPRWPQLLMMTQLSACYFFAAASKVNPAFLTGAPLSHWVWVPLPWWCFTLMAFATVLVELFLSLGLWFARTRRTAVALGLMLHVSIVIMMREHTWALLSFAITCTSLYPLFLTTHVRRTTETSPGPSPHPATPRTRLHLPRPAPGSSVDESDVQQWEVNGEGRADEVGGLDADLAAVVPHDRVDDGQPQP